MLDLTIVIWLYLPSLNNLITYVLFSFSWLLINIYLPCTFYNKDHHCTGSLESRCISYNTLLLQGHIPKEYKHLQNVREWCHFPESTRIFSKTNVQPQSEHLSSTNLMKFLGIILALHVSVCEPGITPNNLKKSSQHPETYCRGPTVTLLSSFNEAIATLRRIKKLWNENQKGH